MTTNKRLYFINEALADLPAGRCHWRSVLHSRSFPKRSRDRWSYIKHETIECILHPLCCFMYKKRMWFVSWLAYGVFKESAIGYLVFTNSMASSSTGITGRMGLNSSLDQNTSIVSLARIKRAHSSNKLLSLTFPPNTISPCVRSNNLWNGWPRQWRQFVQRTRSSMHLQERRCWDDFSMQRRTRPAWYEKR